MKNKLIFFILLIVILSVSGCTESYGSTPTRSLPTQNSYQEPDTQQDYINYEKITDEYNKHVNTFKSDFDNILSIVDQFDMNDERIVRNNEVTLERSIF